jgi:hypothetical protein
MDKIQTGIFKNINSVSDIIFAMIHGLKKEWVEVDMDTFGSVTDDEVCFGCAATNTLCQLMDKPFTVDNIIGLHERAKEVNFGISTHTLRRFEVSIDNLRTGCIITFLLYLSSLEDEIGFVIEEEKIKSICMEFNLPELENSNYKTNLIYYEQLASALKKEGL